MINSTMRFSSMPVDDVKDIKLGAKIKNDDTNDVYTVIGRKSKSEQNISLHILNNQGQKTLHASDIAKNWSVVG